MQNFTDYKFKKIFDEKNNFLGEINGILFDIDYEKVLGFIYKKNIFSYDFFLLNQILQKENEKIIISKIKQNLENIDFYEIIGKNVKNLENQHIGTVEDIEFDLTYKLKNLIIVGNYHFSSIQIVNPSKITVKKYIRKINKKHIFSYQKDSIIIKDKIYLKENKKILENISKIFINILNPAYQKI